MTIRAVNTTYLSARHAKSRIDYSLYQSLSHPLCGPRAQVQIQHLVSVRVVGVNMVEKSADGGSSVVMRPHYEVYLMTTVASFPCCRLGSTHVL